MPLGPVFIGIDGTRLSAESRAHLGHPLVGGVVLFSRNFENREQLRALIESIKSARQPSPLIAVDQEGGRVQRFRKGFTCLPALGRIGELQRAQPGRAVEYSYWHGRVMASEMLELGVDLSFAPVLDLDRGSNVIGDRAFCASAEGVVELGRSYLAGMHDAGMKTTGKHFPGHGSVRADSHVADVCDSRSLEEIQSTDLVPFTALADQLDALMIAHVSYPCVDDKPAGYSPAWLGQVLRRDMRYRGVIFSDDLGMHAAKALGNLPERTRAALEAGCDAVLVCRPGDVRELLEQWGDRKETFPREPDLERLRPRSGMPPEAIRQSTAEAGTARGDWPARLEALN